MENNTPKSNPIYSMDGVEELDRKSIDLNKINYEKKKLANSLGIILETEKSDEKNEVKDERLGEYEIGDIVEGEVSSLGITLGVDLDGGQRGYFPFVEFEDGWIVENGEKIAKPSAGDKIKAKIIGVGKLGIRLSFNQSNETQSLNPNQKLITDFKNIFENEQNIEDAIEEQNSHRDEKISFLEPGASFVEGYFDNSPYKDFLRMFMEGKPVINLGAGMDKALADKYIDSYGASKYIGIDLLNPAHHKTNLEGQRTEGKTTFDKYYYFQEDMLRYLSKMPTESANITLNGIDGSIVTSKKYCVLLAMHISRVAPKGGIVFGSHSEPVFGLLEQVGFKKVLSISEGFEMDLFVKA